MLLKFKNYNKINILAKNFLIILKKKHIKFFFINKIFNLIFPSCLSITLIFTKI